MTPIFFFGGGGGGGEEKIFGKLESSLLRYPMGRKFRQDRSHTVKEIQAVLCFTRKLLMLN